MRRILNLSAVGLLFITGAVAQSNTRQAADKQAQLTPKIPTTVDEAVFVLKTKWMSPQDLNWLLRNPQKQAVAILYRPFGTSVRNQFELWGRNQELRDSCRENNAEACSVVIFNRLWESVRSNTDPALVRQLDCQFQLAETIHINFRGFYKLTTGKVLKAMQSQIDDQMAKFAASGTPSCQNSLMLEVAGKPDKSCFIAAPFARHRKDQKGQPTEATLETILWWLGRSNFFITSYAPPKVTLNFARQCQFPTPPYLY
jgi:hypothetical protein